MAIGNKWSIKQISRAMKKTVNTDKDFLCIIDGETGTGKSTFAIKLAKRIAPKTFKIKKNVIFSRDQLIDAITEASPGSVFVVDEAINVLFKRDFATKKQKFLLRLLDMCRSKNLILLMCVPNFWAIDKHVLERRIKLRIHIARTGMAFLWKPSGNPFTPDPWYRKYNEKVCWSWDNTQSAVARSKGYVGFLKFNDLSEKNKQIYWKHKESEKQRIKEEEEAEDKKETIQDKQLFDTGMLTGINFLRTGGMLKPGALPYLARKLGVKRRSFEQKVYVFNRDILGSERRQDVENIVQERATSAL